MLIFLLQNDLVWFNGILFQMKENKSQTNFKANSVRHSKRVSSDLSRFNCPYGPEMLRVVFGIKKKKQNTKKWKKLNKEKKNYSRFSRPSVINMYFRGFREYHTSTSLIEMETKIRKTISNQSWLIYCSSVFLSFSHSLFLFSFQKRNT